MPESRADFLKQFIEANKSRIRSLQTDLSVPRLLDEEIASLQSQIAKLQSKLDAAIYRKANVKELLCSAEESQRDALAELKTLQHSDKIAKLKELRDRVESLEQEAGWNEGEQT